jgi:hypothetical protein
LARADITTEDTERTEQQGVEKPGKGFLINFSVTSVFSVVQMFEILLINAGQGRGKFLLSECRYPAWKGRFQPSPDDCRSPVRS